MQRLPRGVRLAAAFQAGDSVVMKATGQHGTVVEIIEGAKSKRERQPETGTRPRIRVRWPGLTVETLHFADLLELKNG